uniref:Uncharacterized protein n=1 Tax=Leersia perrieri TaxID=77586 RepID=A0A0D9UZP7_9ORYZ
MMGYEDSGWHGSRRKPSSVFCWADSGYAFGRRNPLEGAVEVPPASLPMRRSPGENLYDDGGILRVVTLLEASF